MNYYLLVILIALIFGVGAILFALFSLFKKITQGKNNDQSFLLLQNQIEHINKTLDQKLSESRQEMQSAVVTQFSESQKLIKDITAQVSQVQESNKQVFTIADQLQNLEKVLKNQKQRGNLGEASLELILSNILPPNAYKIQYEFSNKEKVDAVILTKEGMIPVDAKFSLDNYNRIINESDETRKSELEKDFKSDLKKRIDETSKYIKTNEGTLPFAFMFIPAEGIYYDLLVNEVGSVKVNTRSLIDYAYKEKNVIIVSPTTFAAYLQSVLYGFRAFKIEESAREIRKRVDDLSDHLRKYDSYMKKLGNHLGTSVNAYNFAYKELGKVDKDILKITEKSSNIEPVMVEGPKGESEE
ncbi:MAG TPA: DNA recombination protein RmuC [Candidatus Paceibacterota bacterium]|nr:DNA recombination protein RmuC [Candidatus Paceibacterota bacterium]HPT40533.1 DNA recombination protein RmuC [Candidatus Paceibacterota bacterium]